MTKQIDFDAGDVVVPVGAVPADEDDERVVDGVYQLVIENADGEETARETFITFKGDPVAYPAEGFVLADHVKMDDAIILDELF